MLVLSRRPDQQIVFPNLDIKLQVLQVRGKVVKIGIDAPKDIRILRPDACDQVEPEAFQERVAAELDRHHLRNRLNTINLGLRLFQKLSDAGQMEQAEQTMQRVIEVLQKLDQEVGTARDQVKRVVQARQRTLQLLVVEDDDNERELLAGLLRLHGFQVSTASNGEEALDYLEANEVPDFVLLDMNMPHVDGPSTIREIRKDLRLKQLKVFAVSGTSPEVLGVDCGYNGWFPKPLDPERLIQVMTQDSAVAHASV